jgi:hypothetical protein
MSGHLYHHLDEIKPTTRLLELSPAELPEAPLTGHLQTVLLASAPPYEALSYTWGAPEYTEPVLIDGHELLITPNLAEALRSLRLRDKSRVLWIDAICINQDSLLERAHQVTLMGKIYSQCTRDILWLGPNPGSKSSYQNPTADELGKGLQLMKRIADKDIETLEPMLHKWSGHLKAIDKWGYNYTMSTEYYQELKAEKARRHKEDSGSGDVTASNSSDKNTTKEPTPFVSPDRDNNGAFLEWEEQRALEQTFSYALVWRRLWIMQELSLAPNILLVAGQHSLNWDHVTKFLGNSPYADAFHGTFSHGTIARIGPMIFSKVQIIDHQRRIMKDVAAGKAESKLLDVLARFRSCDSSDPRDKIFGLLGLATDNIKINIDYISSPQEVYSNITVSLINHMKNLDIICQSPWKRSATTERHSENPWSRGVYSDKHLNDLPSWAADFQHAGDVHLFAQRSIFNAGGTSCHVPCEVIDGRVLGTRGIMLGSIGPIVQQDYNNPDQKKDYSYERWKRRSRLPIEWMNMYSTKDIMTEPQAGKAYITGEPAFTAFWRTLVIDCEAYPMKRLTDQQIGEEDANIKSQWLQRIRGLEASEEDSSDSSDRCFSYNKLERMWEEICRKWTFGMTTNGLYVLFSPPAKEGDIIACLEGGKVPIILRPVHQDGSPERYKIITTAYVHGFMDIEAAESMKLREKLGLEEQNFWLV